MIRYQKFTDCEMRKESMTKRNTKCCAHNSNVQKCSKIKMYTRDYTRHSSLHGVQYLGEPRRSKVEKAIWLLVILLSITTCLCLIWLAYVKWQTSPILITVGDVVPIEDVTFPAVTVCPAMKVSEKLTRIIEKFDAGHLEDMNEEEKYAHKRGHLWCTYYNFDEDEYPEYAEDTYSRNILNFIYDHTPHLDDVFEECEWNGYNINCSDIFTPVFTEDGVCFTFNSLNHSDLFKPHIQTFQRFNSANKKSCFDTYSEKCKKDAYPYRTSPRLDSGLVIVLKMPKNHSSPCVESADGHNIIIHHPSASPHVDLNNFHIPPYESVRVDIKPEFTVTDEGLRNQFSSHMRRCFFDGEKFLKHFSYFTQSNCRRECYQTIGQIDINCSSFYMPHTPNTRICNSSIDKLVRKFAKYVVVNHHLAGMDIYRQMLEELPKNVVDMLLDTCTCFPPCKILKYMFEIICTDCDYRMVKHSRYDNENTTFYSEMSINFKNIEISPRERKALFGPMDFIAYCGGLLGLFIGFSLISLLEALYFFCIRPCCNMILFGQKHWMGTHENLDAEAPPVAETSTSR